MAVAGLVLAAGAGRRYGGPKALVRLGGELLVDRAVRVARDAGCAPVVVVLGAESDTVRERARGLSAREVQVVCNPDHPAGMGSSLRAGLAAMAATGVPAVVVLLVDTPGVTPAAVARLAAGADQAALRAASYAGRRGHPVLLGRDHWAGVARMAAGDVGARDYLAAHAADLVVLPCDDIADGADLDRPAGVPGYRRG